jgi:hypothetical protein
VTGLPTVMYSSPPSPSLSLWRASSRSEDEERLAYALDGLHGALEVEHAAQHDLEDLLHVDGVARGGEDQRRLHRLRVLASQPVDLLLLIWR